MVETDLKDRIWRHADRVEVGEIPFGTEIPGFTLVRCREETRIEPTLYKPLACVVLQGAKESFLGEAPVRFSAGQTLIVSLDIPTVSRIVGASPDAPYIAMALELDLSMMRSLAAELSDTGPGSEHLLQEQSVAIAAGDTDPNLLDAMERLFNLIGRPSDQRVLLPLILREIHFRLLSAGHGAMLRRLMLRDSHVSRIARAVSKIRSDIAAPIRIAELSQLAGMSPSSFHEHFKSVTAKTPLQFQKDIRLQEARSRLIGGAGSVTEIAFTVGYESPTQFSREYARKFGVSPRADRQGAS
ncbi:AraC family transcriptional regulator [Rhodospirillaceae bacterium KN72]|uniref:AraC family transcriptional regulator n=1 Tax=Pacificispira spongiicola TaxID=2729598 RepID=A0A7Y0E1X7_9PROT|nr:AraC family transcriptional regulator [Pacificispira spongiicola]NMM45648.1 AraC family transcriptional regulator [Pacificispira spongiicola]